MKLGKYKKLKAVLDTDEAKKFHRYDFIGRRWKDNDYDITLYPDTPFGAIHCLPYLIECINKVNSDPSIFMSSHSLVTKAPSGAMHFLCVG